MGITDLSLARINRYLKPNSNILIIGCQNLYNAENYGQIAHGYFVEQGHSVRSLDILGCQGSERLDLREDLKFEPVFDMVNDCGSKEHIDGDLYIPFKNIHDACKVNGVMIHENPAKNHWPGHGQHYFTTDFYKILADVCDYDILELGAEPAMGNLETGMNIYCVLKRWCNDPFIHKEQFDEIYADYIFSK